MQCKNQANKDDANTGVNTQTVKHEVLNKMCREILFIILNELW